MKIEKHGNQYRVRKTVGGQKIMLAFDHKPNQQEIIEALAENDFSTVKDSFLLCAKSYIESKRNVLSPKTVKDYYSLLNYSIPTKFKQMPVSRIRQTDIQIVVNEYATNHAPKTVRNFHGFISAVLRHFRPNMSIHTTLPQKRKYEAIIPSYEDVMLLLDASRNDKRYHVAFQLGVMGLRRSEICALTLDDINGNILTINKAVVQDDNKEWVEKTTKTEESTRQIYIPDALVKEIRENGYIYQGHAGCILKALHRYQDKLNLPHFRLHDMRHFFASYAHEQGISDADIIASGGWRTDYTMKRVYRHEMKAAESQKKIFDSIISG